MSFNEVLAQLPNLTPAERQLLVRRALDLDDAGLPPADHTLVATRLAEHHRDPTSALSLPEMEARLRKRLAE